MRRVYLGLAGLPVLIILLAALTAPWLAPFEPAAQARQHRLRPPAWQEEAIPAHMLGTDQLGRDILSRLLSGARISLLVSFGVVTLAGVLGTLAGLASGWMGGWVDSVITNLTNMLIGMPFVVFAFLAVAILGPGLQSIVMVMGLLSWPTYAKVVRSEVLSLKNRDFVLAAHAMGATTPRILFKHILPLLFSPLMVLVTLDIAKYIIAESFLSFLGIGVQPPLSSWGSMLAEGRQYMISHWWLATLPGLCIFLTTVSFTVFGEVLADFLNPKLKGGSPTA